MSINVILGGTQGATDGTVDVEGDGNGITLGSHNTVARVYLRADTAGHTNDQAITASAPENCDVRTDGSNFGASATITEGIVTDKNAAFIEVRRIAGTAQQQLTMPISGLGTSVLAPVAPVLSTPTVGSIGSSGASIGFDATDANGDAVTYKVAVTTSATPPSDWSGYANVTSPYAATGLTASTDYYAHVRASDGTLSSVKTSAKFTTTNAAETTAPVLAGSLTATAGTAKVDLSWPTGTDNVGVTGYDIEYGTSTSYGTALTSTTNSKSITGLINAIPYYFRVRAFDASGNKSDWITATATPALDHFNGSTLSTSLWTTSSSGAASANISNSVLTLNSASSTANAILVYRKTKINMAQARTYSVCFSPQVVSGGGTYHVLTLENSASSTAPVPVSTVSAGHNLTRGTTDALDVSSGRLVFQVLADGQIILVRATNESGGTLRQWVNGAWAASGVAATLTPGTFYIASISLDGAGNFRMKLCNVDGSVIADTGWQTLSEVNAITNGWLHIGCDPYTDAWYSTVQYDWYNEV